MKLSRFTQAMRIGACLLIMSCASFRAIAEIPVSRYADLRKNEPAFSDYLVGVGRGIFWANTVLQGERQQPLFCVPGKLALDDANIVSMLDREIRTPSSGRQWEADTPVELILVIALKRQYPCN